MNGEIWIAGFISTVCFWLNLLVVYILPIGIITLVTLFVVMVVMDIKYRRDINKKKG